MKNVILFSIALITVGFMISGILYKKIPSIITSYIKADTNRRIFALIIDFIICSILGYYAIFSKTLNTPSMIALIAFILFKDSFFQGRSPGKIVSNLVVIRLKDGKPAGIADSVSRNFIFIIPGVNIGVLIFESIVLFRDKQGIRLGDKIAKTQVVMGKTSAESILDLILYTHDESYPTDKRGA